MFGLTSVVYHSNFIFDIVSNNPEPLLTITPLLNDGSLLIQVKYIVKIDSDTTRTGISPHVI